MNKEYIYIGKLVHTDGETIKDLGLPEKKIGKTTTTPEGRAEGITNTNSTIGYVQIAAWEVEDCTKVESAIHALLSGLRITNAFGKRTEFFKDPNGDLVDKLDKFFELTGLGESYSFTTEDGINDEPIDGSDKLEKLHNKFRNRNPRDYNFYLQLEDALKVEFDVNCTNSYFKVNPKGQNKNLAGIHVKKDHIFLDNGWMKVDGDQSKIDKLREIFVGWDEKLTDNGYSRQSIKLTINDIDRIPTIIETLKNHIK